MNTHKIAKQMLRRAEIILEEARLLEERKAWNLVVRRCQEVVELALKAALFWAGIEAPHLHDVGPILRRNTGRFKEPFKSQIPRLASISRSLRAERETSFYGDEQSGVPPEELYTYEDAQKALTSAIEVLDACRALIGGEG